MAEEQVIKKGDWINVYQDGVRTSGPFDHAVGWAMDRLETITVRDIFMNSAVYIMMENVPASGDSVKCCIKAGTISHVELVDYEPPVEPSRCEHCKEKQNCGVNVKLPDSDKSVEEFDDFLKKFKRGSDSYFYPSLGFEYNPIAHDCADREKHEKYLADGWMSLDGQSRAMRSLMESIWGV